MQPFSQFIGLYRSTLTHGAQTVACGKYVSCGLGKIDGQLSFLGSQAGLIILTRNTFPMRVITFAMSGSMSGSIEMSLILAQYDNFEQLCCSGSHT